MLLLLLPLLQVRDLGAQVQEADRQKKMEAEVQRHVAVLEEGGACLGGPGGGALLDAVATKEEAWAVSGGVAAGPAVVEGAGGAWALSGSAAGGEGSPGAAWTVSERGQALAVASGTEAGLGVPAHAPPLSMPSVQPPTPAPTAVSSSSALVAAFASLPASAPMPCPSGAAVACQVGGGGGKQGAALEEGWRDGADCNGCSGGGGYPSLPCSSPWPWEGGGGRSSQGPPPPGAAATVQRSRSRPRDATAAAAGPLRRLLSSEGVGIMEYLSKAGLTVVPDSEERSGWGAVAPAAHAAVAGGGGCSARPAAAARDATAAGSSAAAPATAACPVAAGATATTAVAGRQEPCGGPAPPPPTVAYDPSAPAAVAGLWLDMQKQAQPGLMRILKQHGLSVAPAASKSG